MLVRNVRIVKDVKIVFLMQRQKVFGNSFWRSVEQAFEPVPQCTSIPSFSELFEINDGRNRR
jgi:hypothetical protein